MTDPLPLPEDQRLKDLSPKAYEHPADRAATAALQSIPMLDTVVKKLIEFGYERALRQILLSGSVKLGPDQIPELWAAHRASCARLDLPEIPDVYLTQFPIANAAAIGADKPIVLVNSRAYELLDEQEMRTVLGHEAGHILSEHVMYRTALMILLSISFRTMPMLAGLPLLAVRLALLEWFRASELSSDRAATLVNRDPLVTCRTMMALAGGIKSKKLNLEAFLKQAEDYESVEPGWDRLSRLRTELGQTHAAPVRRVTQIMEWVRSGDYDRIMRGEYLRRGDPVSPRAEAKDAADHYEERFRGFFKDVDAGLAKANEKVGDAAEKVTEWLKERR